MMYYLKGVLIGMTFGIPIGAIGALTINRTIIYGAKAGLISGIGCCMADLCYSIISVFGFKLISDFMLKHQNIITLLGSILIIIMGICIIIKKQTAVYETVKRSRLISFFASSFIIAVTNPATIITFMLAFSIYNIGEINTFSDGVGTILGILTGTCVWWILISVIAGRFRHNITNHRLSVINRILGVLVLLFGLFILAKTIYSF